MVDRREAAHSPGFIYIMSRANDSKLKIGYTGNLETRRLQINGMQSGKVDIIFAKEVTCKACAERYIHRRLDEFRNGRTEWFSVELHTIIHEFCLVEAIEASILVRFEEQGYGTEYSPYFSRHQKQSHPKVARTLSPKIEGGYDHILDISTLVETGSSGVITTMAESH